MNEFPDLFGPLLHHDDRIVNSLKQEIVKVNEEKKELQEDLVKVQYVNAKLKTLLFRVLEIRDKDQTFSAKLTEEIKRTLTE